MVVSLALIIFGYLCLVVVESARYSLRHAGYSQEPQAEGALVERTCRTLLGATPS